MGNLFQWTVERPLLSFTFGAATAYKEEGKTIFNIFFNLFFKMAVQQDDFSIFLSSRVDSSPNNTSAQFETKLSSPIRLEGSEWEVGLVNLNYCHTWYSLPKTLEFGMIVADANRDFMPPRVMDIRDANGVIREIPCRGATQEDYNRAVSRPRWATITHPNGSYDWFRVLTGTKYSSPIFDKQPTLPIGGSCPSGKS